jgi:hypothetical protein
MTEAEKQTAIDNITKQILAQGLTSKWSGQGYGSAEANARDMARLIADTGVTDIKQFGKVPLYEPVRYKYTTPQQEVFKDESGRYYYVAAHEEGYGVPQYVDPKTVSPILGKTIQQANTESGSIDYVFQPVDESEIVVKDGQTLVKAGEDFGNKETGKPIAMLGRRQGGAGLFGGTSEGKGNTGYRVQFQPDGTPVFYTTHGSSNDLVNLFQDLPALGTIAQIGAAYFGGPIGSAALNAAMGKSPEDILKAAAMTYIGNAAGSAVSGMEGITDVLGEAGTKVASNVAKQYVGSGGKNVDPVKALLASGFTSGSGDGPNSADFIEGYFQPGGEGYIGPSGGESVFDPTFGGTMPMPTDFTGPGYYDEINNKFVPDPFGGLKGPLGPETGNFDPNKEWEYSLTKPGVWTSKDGEEIDLSYMPDRDTAMTGKELMEKAGAMPGGAKAPIKAPAGGVKPAVPGAKPATPVAKTGGATGANTADTALSNLLQQQTSNAALLSLLGSKPELANIKSYKELFGEGLFGDSYVPPSAGGAQSIMGQNADSASQIEGEEQFFRGGQVDDFDALLQILRS